MNARSESWPLGEIGLAQNHRACLAQFLRHKRIPRRDGTLKRERPSRRHHLVGGVNVILKQNRNAVQRAARARGLALGVERVRNRQRVGIQLDDRVERWPSPVDLFDAAEVHFRQPSCSRLARGHSGLKFGDGQLFHFETSLYRLRLSLMIRGNQIWGWTTGRILMATSFSRLLTRIRMDPLSWAVELLDARIRVLV